MPLLAESLRSLHASLVVFAIVVAGLVLGRPILIPMALATIFAFILAPLIRKLMRWKFPEKLAATTVFLGAVIAVGAASVFLSSQLLDLTASLSTYRPNIVEKVRQVSGGTNEAGTIRKAAAAVERLDADVRKELKRSRDTGSATANPPSSSVAEPSANAHSTPPPPAQPAAESHLAPDSAVWLSSLGSAVMTFLFTAFLLFQYGDLRDRIVRIVGVDNLSGTTAAMTDAGLRLSRMFLAQAMLNFGFGTFIAVALLAIGVPNAILWGVVACFMRWVPFVGSFISAVPPLILAAGVDPTWSMVLLTLAVFLISEPIMGHVIEPLVLGKQAGISPFAMVLAASFWTLVWGPVGLLLAAPLTLVLVVLGRYVPGLEFFSIMLGDEAALSPEEEFYGRLLSRDSAAAALQFSTAADEKTLASATDIIVLPGLALAAQDLRRGRLESERLMHIREAMSEVLEVADDAAETAEEHGDRPEKKLRALVVPARGEVDGLASSCVARVLKATSGWTIESAHNSSGLTALASRGGLSQDTPVDAVILISVGGVDQRHLDILQKRAEAGFPDSRIIVLEPTNLNGRSLPATQDSKAVITRKIEEVDRLLKLGATSAKEQPAESTNANAVRAAE